MSQVQVSEIRRLTDNGVVEPVARFVLMPDGQARLVELRPAARSMIEELLREGVPGPDGTMLFAKDGPAFMQRLPYVLHATYLWATEVFEMDDGEAMTGMTEK
jgi:hypothetical protein